MSPVNQVSPFTDEVAALGPGGFYGLLVSQQMYDALEMRTAMYPKERPVTNKFPVAVDKRLVGAVYQKVTEEQWKEATAT